MELTAEQKKTIGSWLEQGMSLGDVQNRLASELGISMTFLEVRMLVADLGLNVKDKQRPVAVPAPGRAGAGRESAGPVDDIGASDDAPGGPGVSVEVDRVARAGAMASGSVKFSDGTRGMWEIDGAGRLALRTDKQNYSPSPADIRGFQQAIGEQLRKRGY